MSNDITMHNSSELTTIFINDEYLYTAACMATSADELIELANEMFISTAEQLSTLERDFSNGVFDE